MENEQSVTNNQINPQKMTPQESCELIWRALRKASLKGAFDIDECYLIKVAYSKIVEKVNEKKI